MASKYQEVVIKMAVIEEQFAELRSISARLAKASKAVLLTCSDNVDESYYNSAFGQLCSVEKDIRSAVAAADKIKHGGRK